MENNAITAVNAEQSRERRINQQPKQNQQEICRWGLATDCVRHGAKELFVGRTCMPCVMEKRRRYYIDNRDSIIVQNKIRQKQTYKSKKLTLERPSKQGVES